MIDFNFTGINSRNKYLVVIAGPTAVGKTNLAIDLAKHYASVVLSADSRQFYKELNIGTAKPTTEQLETVSHYFVNTKNIEELYGAGHFEKDALKTLEELFTEHQIVFMVGGSGLYIDAVLNGVDDFAEIPEEIRESLNTKFKEQGIEWLQKELKIKDESYFNSVDINNPQRLIRALEIIDHTGLPYSSFLKKKQTLRSFTAVKLLINLERAELYSRINKRVDLMMQEGLLEEVKQLVSKKDLNALKTVGYKELFDYLDGGLSLETAVEKIKQHTRNYAKRQITWFKNKYEFEEFSPNDFSKITGYIDIIMSHG
ncbi:tRNA (adenosine(37)-N6)-dimethylallyltransferase MiaA [Aurantibacillus circumpalustris]|uniref:tRNA (adenosine(37)-N6)-dimethylallyltransferase MiaA n=1 Tax=Aurantibacillus circumpalustris TaxID=3036359 RepID=UPI00295A9744|nr:tRNA (adenosine(37)-N6)-dimethylallyltransferase MiaA [Aurantibacillus circumpalustris]